MDNNHPRIRRRLFPLVSLLLLAGCASTPEEPPAPAPEPEPVVEQAPAPQPEPVVLKPDYPERYVVVKGDTLWDISERFLRDPWLWPELWQKNLYIENPHLIYPGDVLTLIYIDGRPVIQVERRGEVISPLPPSGRKTVKLSPQVREQDIELAIPTIPLDAIRQFLNRPRVVTEDELEQAPYIISSADEHLIAAADHRIYVRGIDNTEIANYVVVRPGDVYVNPDDPDDILGYEAIHVGDSRMQRFGDPATLKIIRSTREALTGDRLLQEDVTPIDHYFIPHSPKTKVVGRIISVLDGVNQIGQYNVVALNLGHQEGMETGHVLAVYQAGDRIQDPVKDVGYVTLPDERAGELMVFRVFDRVSYALVMKATRAMHLMDKVTNP